MSAHNDSNEQTLLGLLLIVGYLATIWYSGSIAWSWTNPQNFGGAIHFLFWWSVLLFIGKIILGAIFTFLGSQVDK